MSRTEKCAIYCRFSSRAQENSFSIEAQEDACREYALKQGWDVFDIYIDRAQSGTSANRQSFLKMIADATKDKRPPFQALIVHKLDRFARSRLDSVKYKHILKKRGIKIISVTQPMIGSGNPEDVLLESLLEGMDEFYSLNLAREAIKGMVQNAKKGFMNGGYPPFGFSAQKVVHEGKQRKKLEINPREAEIVKMIYDLYLERGLGFKGIANELNQQSYKKRDGKPWNKNTIRGILVNEKNVGDSSFGKGRNSEILSSDFIPEPITIKNTHKAIINRSAFKKTLELINDKYSEKNVPVISNSDYLLSGLVFCGSCGKKFVGTAAKAGKYKYYTCGTRIRSGKSACSEPQIPKSKLENKAKQLIKDTVITRKNITNVARSLHDALKEDTKQKSQQKKQLIKEREQAQKKLKKIYLVIEDSEDINFDDFAPRIRELKAMIEELDHEQQKLESSLRTRESNVQWSDEEIINAYIELVVDYFQDENLFQKKSIFADVIKKIEIKEGKFFFHWMLPSSELVLTEARDHRHLLCISTFHHRMRLLFSNAKTWISI